MAPLRLLLVMLVLRIAEWLTDRLTPKRPRPEPLPAVHPELWPMHSRYVRQLPSLELARVDQVLGYVLGTSETYGAKEPDGRWRH